MPLRVKASYGDAKEVGDCYFQKYDKCPYRADCPACADRGHLIILIPKDNYFDTAMRAENCTRTPKWDGHLCWGQEGDIEHLTLVPGCGPLCSIKISGYAYHDWHGYIKNGEFKPPA